MAGSVNKVIIVGNLGRDPETRYTQDSKKIVNMSIATSESWKDKTTGERRERTEWHRVVIFNEGLANIADQYLKKGAKVYLEGQMQTRKWTDNDGNDKYTTEVVLQGFNCAMTMLDSQRSGPPPAGGPGDYGPTSGHEFGGTSGEQPGGSSGGGFGGGSGPAPGADLDDEIPF
jgi:single-strand DNA-binding protein